MFEKFIEKLEADFKKVIEAARQRKEEANLPDARNMDETLFHIQCISDIKRSEGRK